MAAYMGETTRNFNSHHKEHENLTINQNWIDILPKIPVTSLTGK